MRKVGIEAIAWHTSNLYIDLATLAAGRGIDVNKFYNGLGQRKMAVFTQDEDVVTLAAEAANKILNTKNRKQISMVLFATESGVDHSKSAGLFVHKLLELPTHCRVLELKQACYSAAGILQLAMSLIRQDPSQKILLITADIARYGLHSVGESSQGGGAVAMLLSAEPQILFIEPAAGFMAEDNLDFWRPNYSKEAFVNGHYSCDLYLRFLQGAWQHYTNNSELAYAEHQQFCYHVPVPKLVEKAHRFLANNCNNANISLLDAQQQVKSTLIYGREIGNCYTASLYLAFCSLLDNSADLSSQRILFYSYGSGSVAEIFSGIVQHGYSKYLRKDYYENLLQSRRSVTLQEYEDLYNFDLPNDGSTCILPVQKKGLFRLEKLEKHKRIYEKI